MPVFWVGMILVWVFALDLGLIGYGEVGKSLSFANTQGVLIKAKKGG